MGALQRYSMDAYATFGGTEKRVQYSYTVDGSGDWVKYFDVDNYVGKIEREIEELKENPLFCYNPTTEMDRDQIVKLAGELFDLYKKSFDAEQAKERDCIKFNRQSFIDSENRILHIVDHDTMTILAMHYDRDGRVYQYANCGYDSASLKSLAKI